jgi:putative peptide zinc metalloprotease protein
VTTEEKRIEEQAREPAAERANGRPPKLADGIELIGEYADSGYKDPPSIARRADGQIIQLPKLLYAIAERADGRRSYDEIAEQVTEEIGRGVSDDNVRFLVDEKLRPLGVLAQADGSTPKLEKADPLLALKFRAALVPEGVVRALTTLFYPFFYPPVIVAALAGFVAFDVWFFFVHGVAQSARELVYNPLLLLMVFGLVVLATALHEIGHATATRYGGAKPGVMGAGIYIVWPAFYTDVTDAYRLDRKGRLRTDLGGVYFNVLFVLAVAGVYFATGFEPILVLAIIQHFQIFQQLLPFLRLDGYYILSDLTGVPDLFTRIKPTLQSVLPGRQRDESVEELKPWVRVTVTTWVLALVPVLLLIFGFIVVNAPRIFATAWDSFFVHLDEAGVAFGDGQTLSGMVSSLQLGALVLPALGIIYSSTLAGSRALAGGWRWSRDRPGRRLVFVLTTAALVAGVGALWWPNGDYRPVQPNERGTIQGAVLQLRHVGTGRPALTPEREQELRGAPFVDESTPGADTDTGSGRVDEGPAPPSETSEEPAQTSETSVTQTTVTETTGTDDSVTETTPTELTTTTETTP